MSRLAQLQTLLAESPNDAFILFAIAKEHEGLQNDAEAQRFYEQLVEKQPNYVGTYYHLGKLYERLEQPDSALETYQKGMKVATAVGDRHAFSELAGAKMELSDDEDFE